MRRETSLIVGCSVLLLAGCTGGGEAEPPVEEYMRQAAVQARDAGFDEAAEMLEDGVVDSADYEAAVENARRCISDLGVAMSEPQLNPVDNLRLSYTVSIEGVSAGTEDAINACMDGNVGAVETYYVATHEQQMSTPLIAPVRACMEAAGQGSFPDATSMPEFAGDPEEQDGTRRETAFECIREGMAEAFPDVEYYAIGY
jgi:hypothetical protein